MAVASQVAGLGREVLLADRAQTRVSALLREALVSEAIVVELAGLVREVLLPAPVPVAVAVDYGLPLEALLTAAQIDPLTELPPLPLEWRFFTGPPRVNERLLTAPAGRRLVAGEAAWRLLASPRPRRLLTAPSTPASLPGYPTMRIARGFDPIIEDEEDDFAFDFGPRLAIFGGGAETVSKVTWHCSVDAGSANSDAAAAQRILGAPAIDGTIVVQRCGTMLAGVDYLLEAVVTTGPSGRVLSLSAGVSCQPP
jgi:hypothetical protein